MSTPRTQAHVSGSDGQSTKLDVLLRTWRPPEGCSRPNDDSGS